MNKIQLPEEQGAAAIIAAAPFFRPFHQTFA